MPSILIISRQLPDGTVKELFVGAATSDRVTAELLLEKLEAGSRTVSIKSNDSISWPFFILEETSGFTMLGQDDVRIIVSQLLERRPPAPRSEDYFLANLYFVSEQFLPNNAFRDSMGLVNHMHLSDQTLEQVTFLLDEWLTPRNGSSENAVHPRY